MYLIYHKAATLKMIATTKIHDHFRRCKEHSPTPTGGGGGGGGEVYLIRILVMQFQLLTVELQGFKLSRFHSYPTLLFLD